MSHPANLQQVTLGGKTPACVSCQGAVGDMETLLLLLPGSSWGHGDSPAPPRLHPAWVGCFLGAEPWPALRDAQGDPGVPVSPPWYPGVSLGHLGGRRNIIPLAFYWSRLAASFRGFWQSTFSGLGPSSSKNLSGLCFILPPHIMLTSASHPRTAVCPHVPPRPSHLGLPSPGRTTR